jgi:hypothetical protein
MLDSEFDALCDRADINEDEANDALRTVQLLSTAPPYGILLPREEVDNVMWAAATLYAAAADANGTPGGFYRFVEDLSAAMKRVRSRKRQPAISPTKV